MHEVLNIICNLWDAQIKVIKPVWTLPSGAHASPAGVGPFLVMAHCWSQAAADQNVPCTANSFLRDRLARSGWLQSTAWWNQLCTIILAVIQYINEKLMQALSWCSIYIWNLFYEGLFAAHVANLTLNISISALILQLLLEWKTSSNTSRCLCVSTLWEERNRDCAQGFVNKLKKILLFPSCLEYILSIECHCDLSGGVGRCLWSPSAIHLDMQTLFPVR